MADTPGFWQSNMTMTNDVFLVKYRSHKSYMPSFIVNSYALIWVSSDGINLDHSGPFVDSQNDENRLISYHWHNFLAMSLFGFIFHPAGLTVGPVDQSSVSLKI